MLKRCSTLSKPIKAKRAQLQAVQNSPPQGAENKILPWRRRVEILFSGEANPCRGLIFWAATWCFFLLFRRTIKYKCCNILVEGMEEVMIQPNVIVLNQIVASDSERYALFFRWLMLWLGCLLKKVRSGNECISA